MAVQFYDADFKEGLKVKTVKDVEADKFIVAFAQHLKRQGRFEIPKWADVVKTSRSKELPPSDPDWLYVSTASMVRKVYIRAGTGVGGFRKVYGGQQRRGTQTKHFCKSSGKVARYVLQQLEEMGLVEQDENGGRKITKEGQRELDTVAVQAAETAEAPDEDEPLGWRPPLRLESASGTARSASERQLPLAQHLKRQGRFEIPKWADVVKTSRSKELPPSDPDWLYVRTASMVRKVYIRAGTGVGGFRKVYGGQQRRGTQTKHFCKSSGKVARYVLQQLEEMGLVEQDENGGRKITKEGQRELDTVAVQAAEAVEVEED
eukprot:CAMPEP_0204249232 /NCGR_PEP_ID=MMETSP0361-20130328/99562_1 /ASSEMBLY_ACC=CAM_ASM_000343 /TAXON_ID=268821 /ORGANISM="Scrippsiella Hangoei, Strain SHTV-5" /LENGTH=318 /DNA_ID=CAMNT_0051222501 /DNA_START=88 /DNA_END=1044 /DNA_ORIENTATION=+